MTQAKSSTQTKVGKHPFDWVEQAVRGGLIRANEQGVIDEISSALSEAIAIDVRKAIADRHDDLLAACVFAKSVLKNLPPTEQSEHMAIEKLESAITRAEGEA